MPDPATDRLHDQLAFLAEVDKLKSILRQSPLANGTRKENSAEHSWHLALFAITLSEHAEEIDQLKVVQMLLIHDIVEIDAGDSPLHGTGCDKSALEQRERMAAERIFGLLPHGQGQKLMALWLEFEAADTPSARFAKALDRLQPLLLNTLTGGGTWTENNVTEQQVVDRYGPTIERGSPQLWLEARKRVRQHFGNSARTA
ncbi:HD domain-containing protein [Methylobacterium terricola]|uniref:HD domain-containing protein n=1 Tax=Methylobacterium terricola TaxID=2583531 RepID=A0A5C4LM82_9HYPH|nr:HD domain-containing protein [Methylobacterium terricola]TNC15879.1 HD domain-containing protein [Methylobacterium terricola]